MFGTRIIESKWAMGSFRGSMLALAGVVVVKRGRSSVDLVATHPPGGARLINGRGC